MLALDGVSDPGNVGTVIRTAAWFGVSAVLLGEGCADLLNPKTVRATMGGIFQLPICRDVKLEDESARLKRLGFRVTAATMDGSPDWPGWAKNPRSALILGSEARGVSEELLPPGRPADHHPPPRRRRIAQCRRQRRNPPLGAVRPKRILRHADGCGTFRQKGLMANGADKHERI